MDPGGLGRGIPRTRSVVYTFAKYDVNCYDIMHICIYIISLGQYCVLVYML